MSAADAADLGALPAETRGHLRISGTTWGPHGVRGVARQRLVRTICDRIKTAISRKYP